MLALPLLCVGCTGFGTKKELHSIQVGDNRYKLVFWHPWGDNFSDCYLYQCNRDGLECKKITSYEGNCRSYENSQLEVNPNSNEINVFIDDDGTDGLSLDFTYGEQPRMYHDKVQFADYDYYLAYFHDFDMPGTPFRYMLYRCDKKSTDCSRLPFRYDGDGLPTGWLELDEQSGEINIVIAKVLIYTYGSSPKCHVEGCSLSDE